MAKNTCYDSDCDDENCYNPEHYNYICFDPNCDDIPCTNTKHFDKNLLKQYQENTDLSSHNHKTDENGDVALCNCPDCSDNHDYEDSSEEDEEDLLAEGKPLIANRPIQIMVVSGICFALFQV